jgi:hypothetical protein
LSCWSCSFLRKAYFEEGNEVPFLFAQDLLVSVLEKWPLVFIGFVKVQGIALVNALKDLGERDVFRFNQEMDVTACENIGIEAKMVALFVGEKNAEVFLEVGWFLENLLFLPPGDAVIKGAVVFYPGL